MGRIGNNDSRKLAAQLDNGVQWPLNDDVLQTHVGVGGPGLERRGTKKRNIIIQVSFPSRYGPGRQSVPRPGRDGAKSPIGQQLGLHLALNQFRSWSVFGKAFSSRKQVPRSRSRARDGVLCHCGMGTQPHARFAAFIRVWRTAGLLGQSVCGRHRAQSKDGWSMAA